MKEQRSCTNAALLAWYAFGGLLALGLAYMVAREMPAIRRELQLMRM